MTNTLLSALVNGAIAAALLGAAVRFSLLLVPRTILSAAARYVIWWTILVSTLLLPLAYLPKRPLDTTVHFAAAVGQMPLTPTASEPAHPNPPLPVNRHPVRAVGLSLPLLITAGDSPRWLLIGWVFLSAVFLLRLLASICLLARRRAGAVPAPVGLARSVEASLLAHRSSRRAVVLASPTIAAPVLVGLHRPTILIPERLLAELSESELIAVAVHEAAHVARRDDYALLAGRLVQSAFPLHPVVWWIFRQIGLEREIACDAFAVETFGSPRDYAACLVRVMELCSGVRVSWAAAGMAAGRSQLAHRVDKLLAAGRQMPNRPRKLPLFTAVAIVVAFACFAVRIPDAVAFSTPPTPESTSGQETSKDLPVINIQKDGTTYLNDKPYNIHDLGAAIRQKFGRPDAVYVRADKETIYDVIVKVCDQLRSDGFKINLATQPAENSERRGRVVASSIPPTAQQSPRSELNYGIELSAPESTSAQETSKYLPVINIRKDGEIYLNDKPCDIHDLGAAIRQKFGEPGAVYVRADKETIYDVIAKVFDQLRNAGLKISLVTQPVDAVATGQTTPESTLPRFEVAVIKQNKTGARAVSILVPSPGRFNAENVWLRFLIQIAWDIKDFQVAGGPSWATSDRYDVSAKTAGNERLAQMRPMLQSLLKERFQLALHAETRELPIYALVASDVIPKLRPTSEGSCVSQESPGQPNQLPVCGSVSMSPRSVSGKGVSMTQLAATLSNVLQGTVVDQTGLTGTFDVHMEWTADQSTPGFWAPGLAPAPGAQPSPDPGGASIFTVIREQLGLALRATKGPVTVLVIDHAERPSAN